MSESKTNAEYDLFENITEVEDDNMVIVAVNQAVKKLSNTETLKKSARIEDFGEKIGGARKDLYAAYYSLLKEAMQVNWKKCRCLCHVQFRNIRSFWNME